MTSSKKASMAVYAEMSLQWSQESSPQRVPATPELKQFQNDFAPVVPEASVGFDSNEHGRVNERSSNGVEEQINRFNHIVYQHSPSVSGEIISSLSTHQSPISRNSEDATDSQSQINQSPIITSCCSIGSEKNSVMENELQILENRERELRPDKPKFSAATLLSGNSVQKRQITQTEFEKCSNYLWDDNEPIFCDTGPIFLDSDSIFA